MVVVYFLVSATKGDQPMEAEASCVLSLSLALKMCGQPRPWQQETRGEPHYCQDPQGPFLGPAPRTGEKQGVSHAGQRKGALCSA